MKLLKYLRAYGPSTEEEITRAGHLSELPRLLNIKMITRHTRCDGEVKYQAVNIDDELKFESLDQLMRRDYVSK